MGIDDIVLLPFLILQRLFSNQAASATVTTKSEGGYTTTTFRKNYIDIDIPTGRFKFRYMVDPVEEKMRRDRAEIEEKLRAPPPEYVKPKYLGEGELDEEMLAKMSGRRGLLYSLEEMRRAQLGTG